MASAFLPVRPGARLQYQQCSTSTCNCRCLAVDGVTHRSPSAGCSSALSMAGKAKPKLPARGEQVDPSIQKAKLLALVDSPKAKDSHNVFLEGVRRSSRERAHRPTPTPTPRKDGGRRRGLRMKLLIDTKSQSVVFAEAGKDVVDFLFSLLALPLATAVALIGDRSVAGSVGSLYASVQGLDNAYLLPGADRDDLLRPTVVGSPATTAAGSSLLLPPPPPKTFFVCRTHGCLGGGGYSYYGTARRFVTDVRGAACPNCSEPMTDALQYISPSAMAAAAGSSGGYSSSTAQWVAGGPSSSTAKGFVQGVVTYTVKDDLTVTPMSTISGITLLRAFAVTDLAALQEKTVYIGNREGLEILKASLQSKTVLTDVFLGSNNGWSSSGTA